MAGNFLQELKEFFKSILSWAVIFAVFAFFFFAFGMKEIFLFGKNLALPFPAGNSFSVQFFEIIKNNLMPNNVQLIVISPLDAFLSQIKISLFLSFIFTFPFLLYKIIRYLSPALYEKEKKAMFKALIPSAVLFILGCIFAYFFLIPSTFNILYSFAPSLYAVSFFSVNEFISSVFVLMIASGVMFLLPVFMVVLNYTGLVAPDFWKKNWRYAILIFLVLSAIITPDGSGITMILLSLPLCLLYFVGAIIGKNNLNLKVNS